MSTPVSAEELSVGQVFAEAGTSYVVPVYQRNYAWRQEQIDQLVDDVWTAARTHGTQRYFLGNLVVAQRGRERVGESLGRELEVIDGQQRLTTLSLLLRALPGADASAAGRLRYASRPKATSALEHLGRTDDEDGTGIPTAYKIVRQALEAQVGAAGLETFEDYLRTRVSLVRATLVDVPDLNRYFEVMNTRGQQLEQVDIVKARLMRHLVRDPAAQDCFAWLWDACRDMDAYVQMTLARPAADGRRARLRTAVFGAAWDRLAVTGFDALTRLHQEHVASGAAGSAEAGESRSLAESLRAYAAAAAVDQPDDEDTARFRSPIGFPSLLLHVLKVQDTPADDTDEGRLDDNRLIRLFDERFGALGPDEATREVQRFAEQLLRCRFVFDNYVLKREYTATNGDDGAWSLKRLVRSRSEKAVQADRALPAYPASFAAADAGAADATTDDASDEATDDAVDPSTSEVLMLQSMLRVTYTSPRTMHWITEVLRLPGLESGGSSRAGEVRSALRAFARRRVEEAFFAGEQPTGFAIERIVFTYLDHLLAREHGTSYRFAFRNSVEHFFPQTPDQDQAAGAPVPQGLDSFGNLALISVGANSKFSNNMPRLKVGFRSLVEQSPKLQLMASLTEQAGGVWDDAAIERHGREMVDLLRRDVEQGRRSRR